MSLLVRDIPADIRIDGIDFAFGETAFHAAMDRLRDGPLQPPPFVDPVQWIADNIMLPKTVTSRPGPMRLTVYQRELARCLMDPAIDQVDVLKGVQVGYSRSLAALQLYGIVYLGIHVAIAQPTKTDAASYYKDQVAPLFDEVEAAKAIVRSPGRGEVQDTVDEHRYRNGAILRLRGADNPDSLRRFSSEWNFADEVDAASWQDGAGNQQGSKFDLFKDRGTDFVNSKFVDGSTPLIRETSQVWKAYSTSDQRRLHVRCPYCDGEQVLRWGDGKGTGFHYTRDTTGAVTDCWYQCVGGCRIEEDQKEAMVESGSYLPTAIPDRPGHIGLHWPAWHSMAPKAGWIYLAQRWVDAQGDTEKLQTWVNNVAAEPWDDLAHGPADLSASSDLAVPYDAEVPDDVVVLTAGVDVQTNKEGSELEQVASREVSIYGWSKQEMPRLIGHWVVLGEPGTSDAEAQLDVILQRDYRKADGTVLTVSASAEDMGGHFGDAVRARAMARTKRNVWAVKGKNITLGTRSASVWPRKVSRDPKKGSWYMIDTQLAKDAVGRKLKVRGPGGPMFPSSMPAAYFEDLAAERLITDKKGRRFWKRTSKAVTGEAWDCLVYAYAALKGLMASFRQWRDLNLAARKLGISELPPHDPETGELIKEVYAGHDLSAMKSAPEPTQTTPATRGNDGENKMRSEQPEAPAAVPSTPARSPVATTRKSRVMRVSRWG